MASRLQPGSGSVIGALATTLLVLTLAASVALAISGEAIPSAIAALAGVAITSLGCYRSPGVFSGSLTVVAVSVSLVYAAGVLPRTYPVLGVTVSEGTLTAVVVGTVAFTGAMILADSMSPPAKRNNSQLGLGARGTRLFFVLALAAIAVAVLNYSTGDIPLFSGDVNSSRLNGNYGNLGRLWPIVLPILQLVVLSGVILAAQRRLTRSWLSLALVSAGLLFLNGGRSLIVIALLGAVLVIIDIKRPPLTLVVGIGAIAAVAFGVAGVVRTLGTSTGAAAAAYLSERDLDGWWGSLDLSLQTGPQVLELARTATGDATLGGAIFWGDIGNFLNSEIVRSDRIVTALIGRDANIVGGMPPTLWGAILLDWGYLGLAVGAVTLGCILLLSRRMFLARGSMALTLWFGYISSYVVIGTYSYISVRPSWLVVAIICVALSIADRTVREEDPGRSGSFSAATTRATDRRRSIRVKNA